MKKVLCGFVETDIFEFIVVLVRYIIPMENGKRV